MFIASTPGIKFPLNCDHKLTAVLDPKCDCCTNTVLIVMVQINVRLHLLANTVHRIKNKRKKCSKQDLGKIWREIREELFSLLIIRPIPWWEIEEIYFLFLHFFWTPENSPLKPLLLPTSHFSNFFWP